MCFQQQDVKRCSGYSFTQETLFVEVFAHRPVRKSAEVLTYLLLSDASPFSFTWLIRHLSIPMASVSELKSNWLLEDADLPHE